MVDHEHVCYVELTALELPRVLCAVQVVGEVDPAALLVEDSWLQRAGWEVLGGCGRVAVLVVLATGQEGIGGPSVVDGGVEVGGARAVGVGQRGIEAVVA